MTHLYAATRKLIFLIAIILCSSIKVCSQAEAEPNNTFETADPINKGSVKTGTVNNLTDQYDYFVAVFATDGTLKINVTATNNHTANGWLLMYGFDRRKGSGQIFGKYISNNSNILPGAGISDVITVYGRAADSFYFRFETSEVFSYNLSYDLLDLSANDNEPNGTFEEALGLIQAEEKKGHISYVKNGVPDAYDYYSATLPADGTLKIYVKATNNSGANSWLLMYGFDRRKGSGQVFAKYISGSSNIAKDSTIYDTITIHGRAADIFYVRLEASGAWNYSLKYDLTDTSENDMEPNDVFDAAIAMNASDEKKGHISYVKNGAPDQYDYYRTVLPVDGTLKIYVEGTNNSGGNGWLLMYGFDKRKGNGQVFGTYISGSSYIAHGATITDSIIIYGVLADTFYFRFEASGAFKYKLRYVVVQNSILDEEPNNTFDQALPMRQGVIKNGQVGYTTGGVTDTYDYYKTMLPADGTMKIYVKGINNSGANGWLLMYGFDSRKGSGQVLARYISGSSNIGAGATIHDTLTVHGRAADSFYFRFESAGAWTYSLSYDVIDISENDMEPNNSFEESLALNVPEEKKGHIGYVKNGVPDQNDYYKALLPLDGTLKVFVKGTNNSGANGWLLMYGFDGRKAAGQVFARYISGSSNIANAATIYDTITLYGRAADSFYLRLESSGAWSYSVSYDVADTSENDAEPNNTFEAALPVIPRQISKGHIGYIKSGVPDPSDYYKTLLPADGTIKIYVKGTNNSGANGWLLMYGFDGRKGNGQVYGKYISGSSNIAAGVTIYDTIIVSGRAIDSFYFRFESAGGWSYSLSYSVADTSENDTEPNNTFETALPILQQEIKKGHISYTKSGTGDQYDYYRAVLPVDGTLKVMVKATNNSGANGWLLMYGFDRRKGNGQVYGRYVSGSSNIAKDSTIYDTIFVNCRAAHTFYFRLEAAGAFSYNLSHVMVDVSLNDVESNNTFETSLPATIDTTYKGHIGYMNNGGRDNDDYYKTVLPTKGTVKIIVEATNTSGASGWLLLYGYDRRKGSGQVLARYISNNTNVPNGATIRDTITLNCVSTDTFYLRWNSSGCFRYSFKFEYINRQPKANMEFERLGNTVGFRPQLANATSFLWSFGDGTTSTAKYPMKTYTPGFYTARLIVTNSVCNFKDTALQIFTVKGVEYYTPKSGGAGGDVSMQIFGGGLDTATVVKLVKGGVTIFPVEKYTNTIKNHLTAVLDLHFADPGTYDVVIQVPGQPAITYPGGFVINNLIYPYTWSEVQGPSQWRTNVNTRFKLVIGNKGNVTASGVILALVWPKDVTINFEDKFITPRIQVLLV